MDPVSAAHGTLLPVAARLTSAANLARDYAKLRRENIATCNELLALMWAPQLQISEQYEAAQAKGEVTRKGGDRKSQSPNPGL